MKKLNILALLVVLVSMVCINCASESSSADSTVSKSGTFISGLVNCITGSTTLGNCKIN